MMEPEDFYDRDGAMPVIMDKHDRCIRQFTYDDMMDFSLRYAEERERHMRVISVKTGSHKPGKTGSTPVPATE